MVDSPREQPGLLRRLWGGSSSERTRTVRYPINAYGKLPIYKDFISTGLTDTASRDFRNWLDRGFSHRWAVDDDYRLADIPSHSFLFRMPDGKGCVAGSLWGSSDEGGLRKFPFTLFVSFASGQAAADPLTAVEYLGLLDRRSAELRDMFGPGASLASLYRAYRGAEFECPLRGREQILRDGRSAASSVPVSEFARSLLGSEGAARWPKLLEAVADAVGPSSDGIGALRLPLGGALPRANELAFWLLWIARQDPKKRRPVSGILFENGPGPGRATLLFRDLRAEDFLLLHPERADFPDVLDVLRQTAPAPPPVPPSVPDVPAAAALALAPEPPVPATEAASAAPVEPPAADQPEAVSALEAGALGDVAADARAPAPLEAAPFPEAESVIEAGAEPAAALEEVPLDSGGRLRLTRPPFEIEAQPRGAPAPPAEELAMQAVALEAPPPPAAAPAAAAAAISTAPPPEPDPPPAEPPPADPPGWDRPLFTLLEG